MNTNNLRRFHDASTLMRFAVNRPAADIYQDAGNPLPSKMAGAVTGTVVRLAADTRPDLAIDQETTKLLRHGVEETQSVLDDHLRFLPDRTSAEQFVRNPRVIQQIAVLALRREAEMRELIYYMEHHPNVSANGIVLPSHARPPHNEGEHCPAAEFDSERPILPIFTDLVTWSGELSIIALAKHNIVPKLRLPADSE